MQRRARPAVNGNDWNYGCRHAPCNSTKEITNGYIKISPSGYWNGPLSCIKIKRNGLPRRAMPTSTRFYAFVALLLLLTLIPSSGGSQNSAPMQNPAATKSGTVYVCACLKTRSCFCMTEAKMEGPCACGTEGGPPLKPVPSDSAWAKANREALAK
jgi:hypothetical protein